MKHLSLSLRILTVVVLCIAGYGYYTTNGVIAKQSTQIIDLTTQLTNAHQNMTELKKDVIQFKGKIRDLESTLKMEKDRYGRLYKEYNNAKDLLTDAQLSLKEAHQNITRIETLSERLRSDLTLISESRARKDQEIADFKNQIVKHRKDSRKFQEQMAELNREITKREEARRDTGYLVSGPLSNLVGTTAKVLASQAQGSILIVDWNNTTELYPEMTFSISRLNGKPLQVKVVDVNKEHSVFYVFPHKGITPLEKGESIEIVPVVTRK